MSACNNKVTISKKLLSHDEAGPIKSASKDKPTMNSVDSSSPDITLGVLDFMKTGSPPRRCKYTTSMKTNCMTVIRDTY